MNYVKKFANIKILVLCIFCIIFLIHSKSAFAAERLFFPANKSNVLILPQKFEYELISESKLRIGDAILDLDKVNFEILSNEDKTFDFKISWPSSFLKKGFIVLKDNSGISIWQKKITDELISGANNREETIKEEPKTVGKTTQANNTDSFSKIKFRTGSSEILLKEVDNSVIEEIKLHPFFKMCINFEDGKTKIYLCSSEISLTVAENGNASIDKLPSAIQSTSIEINGQILGKNGMIFLQSRNRPITFRALFANGTSLVIDSAIKEVDFKDIYSTPEKTIFIQAKGAEPVSADNVKKISADEWETEVDQDTPFVYLLGDGDIPLRQDFVLPPNIRPESLNVTFKNNSNESGYSNSTSVILQTEKGIKLTNIDKRTQLEKIDDENWKWTLSEFIPNKINRRFIKVSDKSGSYLGAADYFRGKQFEVSARAMAIPVSIDLGFSHWFNTKYGWSLSTTQYLTKQDNEPNFSLFSINGYYRLTPGLLTEVPSHKIFVSLDNYTINSNSNLGLGLGAIYHYQFNEKWHRLVNEFNFLFKLPDLGLLGSRAINGFVSELTLKKKTSKFIWETGLKIDSYSYFINSTTTTRTSFSRYSALFGINYQF